MFCPSCGSEFVEGITRCNSCDVLLVVDLDEDSDAVDENEDEDGLTELLSTVSVGELEAAVAMVDAARIPYLVQAGTAMNMLHRSTTTRPGNAWEARLWVDSTRITNARERLTTLLTRLKNKQQDPEEPKEKEPTDG